MQSDADQGSSDVILGILVSAAVIAIASALSNVIVMATPTAASNEMGGRSTARVKSRQSIYTISVCAKQYVDLFWSSVAHHPVISPPPVNIVTLGKPIFVGPENPNPNSNPTQQNPSLHPFLFIRSFNRSIGSIHLKRTRPLAARRRRCCRATLAGVQWNTRATRLDLVD